MLSFLFKKKAPLRSKDINHFYKKLKEIYNYSEISDERKTHLSDLIERNGYLPYPHIQALEELTPAETLFCLEQKWKMNNIFNGNNFEFENENISAVKRGGFKNADWMKREQHSIKLVNLAALGDGNKSHEVGKFIDWLKQLLILPSGNLKEGVLATTIYLIPFHPREFGCAYLPTSSSVSQNLEDKLLKDNLSLDAKEQVKLFITLSQLAGHPVIYDVLPQTGRFSKIVLANPHIARWFDVENLIIEIAKEADKFAEELKQEFDEDDVQIVSRIYKSNLKCGSEDLSEQYKVIYDKLNEKLEPVKKELSWKMLSRCEQAKLHKRVKEIIAAAHNTKSNKITEEDHVTNQGQAIQDLIKAGLWSSPGGAWCSAGIPIFEKMSECGGYPLFKHYDFEGNDVSNFANLDCQTPYYFTFLETGDLNYPVIDFCIESLKDMQKEYNFDGMRVDHIDHIVDKYSEKNGKPISYRAPKVVIGKANKAIKEQVPYFATLAEYMLWDKYYKEYHQEMHFDVLWGDDIVSQHSKTPEEIMKNNCELQNYNNQNIKLPNLSILKTYNNQDGEFRVIDQYPGQLGERGALFKWFKMKFIPGGRDAQRPVLYIDGDESFTTKGIESTIGSEISLARTKNIEFFKEFNAIERFAVNNELTLNGEAQIITEDEDGFVSWMVSKDPIKETLLIVANYQSPKEKVSIQQDDGTMETTLKEGTAVENKTLNLPSDYKIISEIVYDKKAGKLKEQEYKDEGHELHFEKLEPAEYKIYRLQR